MAVPIFTRTASEVAPSRNPSYFETWMREAEFAITSKVDGDYIVVTGTGIDPTGATDSGAAINALILANPGRRLVLPAGVYKHADPIKLLGNNTSLEGMGRSTRLESSSTTANCVEIGDGTTAIENPKLKNLVIWSSVTKTGGYAILARLCYSPIIENVDMGNDVLVTPIGGNNRLFNNIYFDRFFNPVVWGGQTFCQAKHMMFRGNADGSFGQEAFVSGNIKMRFGTHHFHVGGGTGGINLGRVDAAEAEIGLLIDTALQAAINREVKVHSACAIDSCVHAGVRINQSISSTAQFILLGWFASTGRLVSGDGIGIDIVNANNARILVGGKVYNNLQSGVVVRDVNAFVRVLSPASLDANGGYGINPTVSTSNLLIDPGVDFTGNISGDFNTSLMDRPLHTVNRLNLRHNPATSWSINASNGSALSIAAGGAIAFAAGAGLVMLMNDTSGNHALFLCGGGNVEKVGGSSDFVAGSPGASQVGFRFNGGSSVYEVANGYATTQTIRVASIQTRAAS